MYGYLARASSLSMTVEYGRVGSDQRVVSRYGWIWPERQVIRQSLGGEEFEYRQGFRLIHVLERASRSYSEFPSPGRIVNPPADYPSLRFGYPVYHVTLKGDTERSTTFEDAGKVTEDGVAYDELRIPGQSGPGGETPPVRVLLDAQGRIAKVHFFEMTDFGPVAAYFEYKNYDTSRSSVSIPSEVERGFMPNFQPKMQYPPGAYDGLLLGSYTEARSGAKVDLGARYKNRRVAVLVTTPDCAPSAAGEATWRKARVALAKMNCELVEIVVGGRKPDLTGKDPDRTVYWEETAGALGSVTDVPVTPYLYVANREGMITQVWAGYAKDQERRLLDVLARALKDQP